MTLVPRLKETFEMSNKRIKKLNKSKTEKSNCRKFIFGWVIQAKLDTQNYELIFIDEFSLSDRWLKFYGWSERRKWVKLNIFQIHLEWAFMSHLVPKDFMRIESQMCLIFKDIYFLVKCLNTDRSSTKRK